MANPAPQRIPGAIKRTFRAAPVPGGQYLTLNVRTDDEPTLITVDPAATSAYVEIFTALADGPSAARVDSARIVQSSDLLKIMFPARCYDSPATPAGEAVILKITVPPGTSVDFLSRNGDITVHGALETLIGRTHDGALSVETVRSLEWFGEDGVVTVNLACGRTHILTSKGPVTVDRYAGLARLGGGARVFPASYAGPKSRVDVSTASGDISITALPGSTGDVAITSDTGDVTLTGTGHLPTRIETNGTTRRDPSPLLKPRMSAADARAGNGRVTKN